MAGQSKAVANVGGYGKGRGGGGQWITRSLRSSVV